MNSIAKMLLIVSSSMILSIGLSSCMTPTLNTFPQNQGSPIPSMYTGSKVVPANSKNIKKIRNPLGRTNKINIVWEQPGPYPDCKGTLPPEKGLVEVSNKEICLTMDKHWVVKTYIPGMNLSAVTLEKYHFQSPGGKSKVIVLDKAKRTYITCKEIYKLEPKQYEIFYRSAKKCVPNNGILKKDSKSLSLWIDLAGKHLVEMRRWEFK